MNFKKHRHIGFRVFVWLVILSQIASQAAYADLKPLNKVSTLAPPSLFQESFPDERSAEFKRSVLSDIKLLAAAFSIGAHYLVDNKNTRTLARTMRDEFRNNPSFLEGIDLENVRRENNIIYIPLERKGSRYELRVSPRDKFESLDKSGSEWAVSPRFGIQAVRLDASRASASGKAVTGSSLIGALASNGDINFWDEEIAKTAEEDPNKQRVTILIQRGENNLRVLHLDLPSVLFATKNRKPLVKYVATSIYNESVTEGAQHIIIFMDDKAAEHQMVKDIDSEIKNSFKRFSIYANFGDEIMISDSSRFDFSVCKEVYPKLLFSPGTRTNVYHVGVDVGGTNIKVVLMRDNGEVVERFSKGIEKETGGERLKQQIIECIGEAKSKLSGKVTVVSLGLTFPSPIKMFSDGSFRIIRLTNFERYWSAARKGDTNFENDYTTLNAIADDIQKQFGIPNISVLNDADAFGFGEICSRIDACARPENIGIKIVLPIGTGPGYVKIKNGVIENIPNQGGHIVIDMSDKAHRDPGCEVDGCYGGYVPASAFEIMAKKFDLDVAARQSLVPTDLQHALDLLKDMANRIAAEAVKLNKITGTDEVILAGGISQGWTGENLARLANEAIQTRYPAYAAKVKISLSKFDINYGGAIGAAKYAAARQERGQEPVRAWDTAYTLPSISVGKNTIDSFFESKRGEHIYLLTTQELAGFFKERKYGWFERLQSEDAVILLDKCATPEDLQKEIEHKGYSCIVAIGAGTLTDWAKFVGNNLKKNVVSIPSALSGNGMFTEKAIFYSGPGTERKRESIVSGPPGITIIDLEFLKDFLKFESGSKIPGERINRAGAGDIVSIYTALLDWKLAAQAGREPIDRVIYDSARNLLKILSENSAEIRENTDLGMIILSELMAEASLLNMRYGTSRPKDGSEHLLADEIDRRLPAETPRLHGELVGIASLIMAYLFKTDYDPRSFHEVKNMVEALGLPTNPGEIGISKEIIIEALMNVHTRPDKYTFFDTLKHPITREEAELVYERVFGSRQHEIDKFNFDLSYYVNNSVKAMFEHISDDVIPNLDAEKTMELIRLLIETKKKGGRVIINAAGRVGEVAVFFQQKLRALGFIVDDFKEITPEFLVNENDLVLTFSGSGTTSSVINNLQNVDMLHKLGKLKGKIFSVTANPESDTWKIGESYHSVMTIKGKTKEPGVTHEEERYKYLPLSSTFEYSVMLYLEGIIEALIRNGEASRNEDVMSTVRGVIEETPASIKEELKENLLANEELTTQFIGQLLSTVTTNTYGTAPRNEEGRPILVHKQRIYLFGLGQNNYVIRLFARRMQNIGFDVYVPGPRDIVSRPRKGDVAVFVSNSGARRQIEEKMLIAKEIGLRIILITAAPLSPLSRISDIVIPISMRTTVSHTADIMADNKKFTEERRIKRMFEIASMFYLEGISVAIMKVLGLEDKDLQHIPKQWELKGPLAPLSNPIIEELIKDGKLAEISLENGSLRAWKVTHVDNYVPGSTGVTAYQGEEVDISLLLNGKQKSILTEWIASHHIRGRPIRFRVALGNYALGWRNDVEHSNIAHAGFRDNAIYIGEYLLQHILKKENNHLRTELLDRDEYRHLQDPGFVHHNEPEYIERLRIVGSVIITKSKPRASASGMAQDLPEKRANVVMDEKIEKTKEILINLGYAYDRIDSILSELNRLFKEIDFDRFMQRARSCNADINVTKALLEEMMFSIREKGYLKYSTSHPRALIRLLINGFSQDDIFTAMEEAKIASVISQEDEEYMKKGTVRCVAISQLAYILLTLCDFNIKSVYALPQHVFNIISFPQNSKRVLFVDLTLGVVQEIDIGEYYREDKGNFHLIKKPEVSPKEGEYGSVFLELANRGNNYSALLNQFESKLMSLFYSSFRMLDARGSSFGLLYNLGFVNERMSEYYSGTREAFDYQDKAIKAYEAAIALNPHLYAAHYRVGCLYQRLGRHQDATRELERSIAIEPLPDAYFHLGNVYYEYGKYDAAVRNWARAVRSESISHDPQYIESVPDEFVSKVEEMVGQYEREEKAARAARFWEEKPLSTREKIDILIDRLIQSEDADTVNNVLRLFGDITETSPQTARLAIDALTSHLSQQAAPRVINNLVSALAIIAIVSPREDYRLTIDVITAHISRETDPYLVANLAEDCRIIVTRDFSGGDHQSVIDVLTTQIIRQTEPNVVGTLAFALQDIVNSSRGAYYQSAIDALTTQLIHQTDVTAKSISRALGQIAEVSPQADYRSSINPLISQIIRQDDFWLAYSLFQIAKTSPHAARSTVDALTDQISQQTESNVIRKLSDALRLVTREPPQSRASASGKIGNISVQVAGDEKDMGIIAAHRVADIIRRKPNAVIALSTGSSPLTFYDELVRMNREEGLDFSRVTTVNTDGYWGLPWMHPQSFEAYMYKTFYDRLTAKPKNIILLRGDAVDPQAEVERVAALIDEAGGVDIQVWGIGSDSHYLFVEPAVIIDASVSKELYDDIRNFNDYILRVDKADIADTARRVLAIRADLKSRLDTFDELVKWVREKRVQAGRTGKALDEKQIRQELKELSKKLLSEQNITLYTKDLNKEERVNLENELRKDCPYVMVRDESEFFGRDARVSDLALSTILDNSRFFDNLTDVPSKGLTMVGKVRKFKEVIFLANGAHKAQAVYDTVTAKKADPRVTANIFQEHDNTSFILDPAAASLLIERGIIPRFREQERDSASGLARHVNWASKDVYTVLEDSAGAKVNIVDLWLELIRKVLKPDEIVICFVGSSSRLPALDMKYWRYVNDIDLDIFVPFEITSQDMDRIKAAFKGAVRSRGLKLKIAAGEFVLGDLSDDKLFGKAGIFDCYVKTFAAWEKPRADYFDNYRHEINYYGTAKGLKRLNSVIQTIEPSKLIEACLEHCENALHTVQSKNLKDIKTLVAMALKFGDRNLAAKCAAKYDELARKGDLSSTELTREITSLKQEFPVGREDIRRAIEKAIGDIQSRASASGMDVSEKIAQLQDMKARGEKITMLTAYDAKTAAALSRAGLDILLVGDSVAMVKYGYPATNFATMNMMIKHIRMVREGVGNANTIIVGDMPYRSYETSEEALTNARQLMQAGADAVKLEGGKEIKGIVKVLVDAGIPVMGHIGYMPQFGRARVFGGMKVEMIKLFEDALALEEAGAFALVLEMAYGDIAKILTDKIGIPTIGIGSGPYTDGQVLVTDDILGLMEYRNPHAPFTMIQKEEHLKGHLQRKPRFVRRFIEPWEDGNDPEVVSEVGRRFFDDVKRGAYPMPHQYYQTSRMPWAVNEFADELEDALLTTPLQERENLSMALEQIRQRDDIAISVSCHHGLEVEPFCVTSTSSEGKTTIERYYSSVSSDRPTRVVLPAGAITLSDTIKSAAEPLLGMRVLNAFGRNIISVKSITYDDDSEEAAASLEVENGGNIVRIPLNKISAITSGKKIDIEVLAQYPDLEVDRIGLDKDSAAWLNASQNYHLLYLINGRAAVLSENGLEVLGELTPKNPFLIVTAEAGAYKIAASEQSQIIKTFIPFEGVETVHASAPRLLDKKRETRDGAYEQSRGSASGEVEEAMVELHRLNVELLPAVEEGKTLVHILPVNLIPQGIDYNQRTKFVEFVHRLKRDYPASKEEIRVVTDAQLAEVTEHLASNPNYIIDIALSNEGQLARIPDGVKALIFEAEGGQLGDFRQLEGILAALRALHIKDRAEMRDKLSRIYGLMTGKAISPNDIPDLIDTKQFARLFKFILPPMTIKDKERLRSLNDNLLRLIESA